MTIMKAEGNGNGVTVPDKLRQLLTNLAAILAPLSVTRRATTKQIHLLARAILDHGQMVAQFYSHQAVGVEERELAFRFREPTHNIVSALVLLENEGRASRTRLTGYWTLRVQPQNDKECYPAMKTSEECKHEALTHSNNPSRKKHYEAPRLTILQLDRAKAQLVARALTGDRDAENLLEASASDTDNLAATRTKRQRAPEGYERE